MSELTTAQLRKEVLELAPWHIDVEIAHGITSAIAKEASVAAAKTLGHAVSFVSTRTGFVNTLHTLYPAGLEQRSFLDCACNCGAYCFWAKESGAGRTFGFDVREHWIRQAKLIQKYRQLPLMDFAVMDLYDLPKRPTPRFDITLFKGILYHLPDPITGLKIAADLTREVLILNTAVWDYFEEEPTNGAMMLSLESTESFMSGVHQLNWFPTGPNVLMKILQWMGFEHVKLHYHLKAPRPDPANKNPDYQGRLEIIAARKPGIIDRLRTVVREK